jgi:glycolate oxidase iron-sulfur subunit
MSTCPSGVNYMHLVDHARHYIEDTYQRPWHERLLRNALALILPYPNRLRAALMAASATRPLAGLIPGDGMFARRLRALFKLAPRTIPAPSPLEGPRTHTATTPKNARVALLAGCAQQVLDPAINESTIRLLTRMGTEVVVAKGAGCCGALTHHMGHHDPAMASAAANIEAWHQELETQGLDAIIINTSGCGTTVKDYGHMFRTTPLAEKAQKISALAMDITEYLAKSSYAPTRKPPGLTVAYHSACSLQHGQKITAQPKQLLQKAGFKVVEPIEPHLCCGSAGTYNILQPDISTRLRARKLENLKATKPDLIAAGNIGCLTQLAGDSLPTIHTIQLLDWMAGGPKPAGAP